MRLVLPALLVLLLHCTIHPAEARTGRVGVDYGPVLGVIDIHLDWVELPPVAGTVGALMYSLNLHSGPHDGLLVNGFEAPSEVNFRLVSAAAGLDMTIGILDRQYSVFDSFQSIVSQPFVLPEADDLWVTLTVQAWGLVVEEEFRCRPVHVDPDDTYTARGGPMNVETDVTYGPSAARLGLRGLICPTAALRTGDGSGDYAGAVTVAERGTDAVAIGGLVVGFVLLGVVIYQASQVRRLREQMTALRRGRPDTTEHGSDSGQLWRRTGGQSQSGDERRRRAEEDDLGDRLEMWRLGSSLVADHARIASADHVDRADHARIASADHVDRAVGAGQACQPASSQPGCYGRGGDSASSPGWLSECYTQGESEADRV